MSVYFIRIAVLVTCCFAAGCATQNNTQVPLGSELLTYHDSGKKQLAIKRISDLLTRSELKNEQKAELHYHKAALLDELGLTHLAYFDLMQAVELKPDYANAYNMLGIYFLRQEEFGRAYEAFDSVLELKPEHQFAYLNRAIALYYGERAGLAIKDFETFYQQDQTDPYRMLWWYFAEMKTSPEEALPRLKQRLAKAEKNSWGRMVASIYTGEKTVVDILQAARIKDPAIYRERLCEAYFYIAKWYQLQGKQALAAHYFVQAINTHVYLFVEFRYAANELNRMHLWPKEDLLAATAKD
ncbi:lipoprotein NlpI [Gayadomonas joobiniege]|uniref:lipoprotein NlpI n=1 Tax=Gayadomonas joobiniege TaxID=1234606 RepID=UPI00035CABEE|nr:lipoprotein NlpI [Gayadomonas joobiniege]